MGDRYRHPHLFLRGSDQDQISNMTENPLSQDFSDSQEDTSQWMREHFPPGQSRQEPDNGSKIQQSFSITERIYFYNARLVVNNKQWSTPYNSWKLNSVQWEPSILVTWCILNQSDHRVDRENENRGPSTAGSLVCVYWGAPIRLLYSDSNYSYSRLSVYTFGWPITGLHMITW